MALSFFAPIIQSENPTQTIARDFPYIEAVNSVPEETPKQETSILATLIDDSAYLSQNDLSLPTEPILGQEIGVSAIVPENQTPIKPPCPISEQCVAFAKETGIDVSGNAWNIQPNLENPEVGAGILLYRHIAIITKIESASYEIIEKNFLGCGVISTRSISFDDSSIRGFVR